VFHAFQEDTFSGSDDGPDGFKKPHKIKVFHILDELKGLGKNFHMGIKSGLPLFGLFSELVGLDRLKNLDEMWSDEIVERVVVRRDLYTYIPAFKGDSLVVIGKVEFPEGLRESIRVALGVVFVDLAEEDLYCARGAVL
jgi:hypothetical protein